MIDWDDVAREAPRIAEVFARRHVEFRDGQLTITTWRPGEGEQSAQLG